MRYWETYTNFANGHQISALCLTILTLRKSGFVNLCNIPPLCALSWETCFGDLLHIYYVVVVSCRFPIWVRVQMKNINIWGGGRTSLCFYFWDRIERKLESFDSDTRTLLSEFNQLFFPSDKTRIDSLFSYSTDNAAGEKCGTFGFARRRILNFAEIICKYWVRAFYFLCEESFTNSLFYFFFIYYSAFKKMKDIF